MAVQATFEQPLEPHLKPVIEHRQHDLSDGKRTTIHIARYSRAAFQAQIVNFDEQIPLLEWCKQNGYTEAINGGFFLRHSGKLLGEVCVRGKTLDHEPFAGQWSRIRAGLHIDDHGNLEIGYRDELPERTSGDILQAGPLLIREGESTHHNLESDPEGFQQTIDQHDGDIRLRHPRAVIGYNQDYLWTLTSDGRRRSDAGLHFHEVADFMKKLGATVALNLDGGRQVSHVSQGQLLNNPRTEDEDSESKTGYPVPNALVLVPRTEGPVLQKLNNY